MVGGSVRVGGAGVVGTGRALARPDLRGNTSTAKSSSSSGRRVDLDVAGSTTSSCPWGAYHARVSDRVTMATMMRILTKTPIFFTRERVRFF